MMTNMAIKVEMTTVIYIMTVEVGMMMVMRITMMITTKLCRRVGGNAGEMTIVPKATMMIVTSVIGKVDLI